LISNDHLVIDQELELIKLNSLLKVRTQNESIVMYLPPCGRSEKLNDVKNPKGNAPIPNDK
jgi:hypothetical protein